jgi:hypothetical protein
MHSMFTELFIETDAHDLAAEKDGRRRVRRSLRARSAMVVAAPMAMTPWPGHSATVRHG